MFIDSETLNEVESSLTDKKILITGASGYLASNLLDKLKNVDCDIVRVSRKSVLQNFQNKARLEDIRGDVSDICLWERVMVNVDIIYHFAAQTSVYVAEQDPESDWKTNVLPMIHLLETCRKKAIRPIIIFSGTVTEVGIPTSLPVNEEPKDLPVTIYDLHKLWAEQYLAHYVNEGLVRGTTLRLSNVYGPGPKSSSNDRGFINLMMIKAIAGETLTIYGEGKYLRDYVFVEDVVDAFLRVPNRIEQVNGRYFVIGSGQGYTVAEAVNMVAQQVAERTSGMVEVKHISPPFQQSPIETRNFVADTTNFREATGWRGCRFLEEGISRTLDYLMKTQIRSKETGFTGAILED